MKKFSFIFLILAGCAKGTDSQEKFTFLTQPVKTSDTMQAQLLGKLLEVKGCLKIENYSVVWPHGFTHAVKDSILSIYNEKGRLVAKIGDSLYVSGGEITPTTPEVQQRISSQLPSDNCKSPYWIVGSEIQILN